MLDNNINTLDIVSLGMVSKVPCLAPVLLSFKVFFPALDSVSEGLGELFLIYYH